MSATAAHHWVRTISPAPGSGAGAGVGWQTPTVTSSSPDQGSTPATGGGERQWDAAAYAIFEDERTRPLHDLIAQIHCGEPQLVVDLGCGNGPATLRLADRWPGARVVGVDSSETMLQAATRADPAGRVEWVRADASDWDPASLGAPPDVIVSNALLQWVPGHLDLLPRWIQALRPGGWFALQAPGNFDAPSHALMRVIAQTHSRAGELLNVLNRPAVAEPSTYLRVLARLGCRVNAWETTYLHVLDREGADPDPVLTWVSATGLRPVLGLLTDEAEREAFLAPYAAALHKAYPRTAEGVVLPFRRVFAVAQRLDA